MLNKHRNILYTEHVLNLAIPSKDSIESFINLDTEISSESLLMPVEPKNNDPFVDKNMSKNILFITTEKSLEESANIYAKLPKFFPEYITKIITFSSQEKSQAGVLKDFLTSVLPQLVEFTPSIVISFGKLPAVPFLEGTTEAITWYDDSIFKLCQKVFKGSSSEDLKSFTQFIYGCCPLASVFSEEGKRLRFTDFSKELVAANVKQQTNN